MITDRRLIPKSREPRFDDQVLAGLREFDDRFACGSPRPDFAELVLTKEFTDLLLAHPLTAAATVILQHEVIGPAPDGAPEDLVRSGVWVTAVGRLEDQELADRITELACDVFEALPSQVVDFHSHRT